MRSLIGKIEELEFSYSLKPNHGKLIPACGDTECCVSTGICGKMTAGTGYLDDFGYWEFPCEICEARWNDDFLYEDWSEQSYLNDKVLDRVFAVLTPREARLEGY